MGERQFFDWSVFRLEFYIDWWKILGRHFIVIRTYIRYVVVDVILGEIGPGGEGSQSTRTGSLEHEWIRLSVPLPCVIAPGSRRTSIAMLMLLECVYYTVCT